MDELNAALQGQDHIALFWLSIGLVGHVAFGGRFFVQWIASERAGQSVIPLSFWILSLGGNMCLLAYAVWRMDPIFILGQGLNSIVYTRNLMLIGKQRREQSA